jgi:hypothetical protein
MKINAVTTFVRVVWQRKCYFLFFRFHFILRVKSVGDNNGNNNGSSNNSNNNNNVMA